MRESIKELAKALRGRKDVLEEVLRRHAEPRGEKGGKLYFTCPFQQHQHKHPGKAHLRIDEDKRGGAVAICDKYGEQGDVFDMLRELEGVQSYPERVRKAAEIAGMPLPERRGAYGGKRKAERRGNAGNGIPRACEARDGVFAPSAAKLSQEQEKELVDAVGRLAANSDALAWHADALGLPAEALLPYADMACADNGLLGLWSDGRLAYVYGARDASGLWRPSLAKIRNFPRREPRFVVWPKGVSVGLWGADGAAGVRSVYVTEGESDALAVRHSFLCLFDWWLHNDPDSYPEAGDLFAVVAKPSACVFKPEWVARLVEKEVVLCADSDAAGLDGARSSAKALLAAGVSQVSVWSPPPGAKDARAYYDASRPCRLAEAIIRDAKACNEFLNI